MADWRKLVVDLVVADGNISGREITILKKHLYADKKIDRKECEFLGELRVAAQKKAKGAELSPEFEKFFFKAVEDCVLDNGHIGAGETRWMKNWLLADGKVDAAEKKFLQALNKKATTKNPAFDKLYKELVG